MAAIDVLKFRKGIRIGGVVCAHSFDTSRFRKGLMLTQQRIRQSGGK